MGKEKRQSAIRTTLARRARGPRFAVSRMWMDLSSACAPRHQATSADRKDICHQISDFDDATLLLLGGTKFHSP